MKFGQPSIPNAQYFSWAREKKPGFLYLSSKNLTFSTEKPSMQKSIGLHPTPINLTKRTAEFQMRISFSPGFSTYEGGLGAFIL